MTPEARLVRRDRLPDGRRSHETIELFDRENGFRDASGTMSHRARCRGAVPRVDMQFLWKVEQPSCETRWNGDALLIAQHEQS
ncbi:MAG: hypothetical protein IPJ24_15875 [bacterium]|nr:hypothetical protein [bacterium]